jgi:hypothetical protein
MPIHFNDLNVVAAAAGLKSALIVYHQWFMCMWTSAQRKKLQEAVKKYEAVIVLGCDSATETVRDAVKSTGCKVIEGMEVAGIMNATLRFHLPCNVSFDDCKVIPISQ